MSERKASTCGLRKGCGWDLPLLHLELELERELDRARAADLVQRIEAAELVAAAEIGCSECKLVREFRFNPESSNLALLSHDLVFYFRSGDTG